MRPTIAPTVGGGYPIVVAWVIDKFGLFSVAVTTAVLTISWMPIITWFGTTVYNATATPATTNIVGVVANDCSASVQKDIWDRSCGGVMADFV